MKKQFLFGLLLIVFHTAFYAGGKDSLITFKDLQFNFPEEEAAFKNYFRDPASCDVLDFFLAAYGDNKAFSSHKAHEQINEFVHYLKANTKYMSEQKAVKAIYREVHERFFKMYEFNNSFSNVFNKGEFNCVSGTAMYSLIFKKMDIPYQIIEAPQHVFLFAYPQTHKILIETTQPKDGYLALSPGYIEKFVTYMGNNKLISKEEIESSSPNELFNKYYFKKSALNIYELAGIQYHNFTLYRWSEKDGRSALSDAKKAYTLVQDSRSRHLLQMVLLNALSNSSYEDNADYANLALLCRFNNLDKTEVSDELINSEFSRLTYQQLISKSNASDYKKAYELVVGNISDTTLKDKISFLYHYEMARVAGSNQKEKEMVVPHLAGAYKINPLHEDLRIMIKSYFNIYFQDPTNKSLTIKALDEYENKFEFLKHDHQFIAYRASCYLELAYQAYLLQQGAKGDKELASFEKLFEREAELNVSEYYVEKAYATAATYYFKKGQKAKTKELLKKGVTYAPNSFGLQIRLSKLK